MKHYYYLLLFISAALAAQIPQGFSYQAVALNTAGTPVTLSPVMVRISILENSASGSASYTETHNPTTNNLGLFTLTIGMGTPVSGMFSAINWAENTKFVKVEIDVNNQFNYTVVGASQLLAVPYAMYAGAVPAQQNAAIMPYFGKKLLTIGDSITRQEEWQPLLATLTGMVYLSNATTNTENPMGTGGSTIRPVITGSSGQNAGQSIYFRADAADVYGPDVIILMGGQNDGRNSSYNLDDEPYTGEEVMDGNASAPSFVSAYKGVLIKLITQNPTAKIIALTPMYTGATAMSAATLASYKLRNDTIKDICSMYSVQCIDLMSGVGISPQNSSTYYTGGVHPNNTGGEKIARYIAGQLN